MPTIICNTKCIGKCPALSVGEHVVCNPQSCTGTVGESVEFSCSPGYQLANRNSVTVCHGDRTWSNSVQPTCNGKCTQNVCLKKSQVLLQLFVRHSLLLRDHVIQAVLVQLVTVSLLAVTRVTNYRDLPLSHANTMVHGTQSSLHVLVRICIRCHNVQSIITSTHLTESCPQLTAPPNGHCAPCSAVSGQQAQFTCDDQYTLFGSSNITCLSDGQWSDSPPTCKSKVEM